MVNVKEKNEYVQSFHDVMSGRLESNLNDLDIAGYMNNNDAELTKKGIEKIQANIIASIPDDIPVPGVSSYISCTGSEDDKITVVNISLNSKIKAAKKFKFTKSFVGGSNIVREIAGFYTEVYTNLIVDYLAEENISEVNQVISDAVTAAGLPFKVSFTAEVGGTDAKLSFISNEEVIFNADLEKIFEVDDLLALAEVSEFISEEDIEGARKAISEEFEEFQTPEQLVAGFGGSFVSYFAGLSKNMKPFKMIQQVCNKSIAVMKRSKKDSMAYYSDGDIFALVAQRDGNLEVILSPFNTKTFRREDVDVLSKVSA